MRKILFVLLALAICAIAFVAGVNWWIVREARGRVFTRVENVHENEIGLVLGTSPTVGGRWSNPFFAGRINAAASLFKAGKVKHLLLSGDNSRRTYDEPTAMRDALIERGVPSDAITLDYAGFRTLDTMARATSVFGLTRCTIISDDFHLPRAIYLATAHHLDACGFVSASVSWKWSKKTRLREIGSRLLAWIDVQILRTKPKFYGPKVQIRIGETR